MSRIDRVPGLRALWLAAFASAAFGLPALIASAAVCVATYEVVRRVKVLRPLFGLKPLAAGADNRGQTPNSLHPPIRAKPTRWME